MPEALICGGNALTQITLGAAYNQILFIFLLPNVEIMKTMTCNQLGGACNKTFSANTFDEIAMLVSKHAREMVQQGDAAHIEAMNNMRSNMASSEAVNAWMDEKRKAFDALQDNNE
jgi:predicted small metal-binding protein